MTRGIRFAKVLGLHDGGRALRDFVTYLPTQLVPALAGFLVIPVLARELAPTELGVLAICQTLVTLGWTIVASWLAAAILRELPAHRVANDLAGFGNGLRRALLGALVAFAGFGVVVMLIGIVSSAVHDNQWLILAATVGLALQNITISIFAASLRPRAYAVVDASARIGGAALGVWLVFEGHEVEGYLAGLASASLVLGTAGLIVAWPRGGVGAHVPIRPWLRYGVPASAAAVATWLLAFVDRYILAVLKDTGHVGVYSVSSVIGDRGVAIPVFAFFTATGPLLVTTYERKGRAEAERLMTSYTRIALIIAAPCIAFITVSASDLVWILTGKYDYARHANIAPVIAMGSFVFALASVAATGLVLEKKTRPFLYAAIAAVIVNVSLNFALIPPFGLMGAALATPASMLVYLGWSYSAARRFATGHVPYSTCARVIVSATAGGVAASAVVPTGGWRPLAVMIVAGVGLPVYAAMLFVLGERGSGLRRSAAAS